MIALVLLTISFSAGAFSAKHAGADLKNMPKGETEGGIEFYKGTWDAALKKAAKEDKFIFLDAYASWCGPCKIMAKHTFTDEAVGAFFNANFINYKMDMEKDADGRRLSAKYKLQAYPTLYFVDGNEELVHQELGWQKPKQLIEIGKLIKAK